MEDDRTPTDELKRLLMLGRPLEHNERRLILIALGEVDALRAMEDEVVGMRTKTAEDTIDRLYRDASFEEYGGPSPIATWLASKGAMAPASRSALRKEQAEPKDELDALVKSRVDETTGVTEAMMQAGIDASPMFLCNDRGGRRIRTTFSNYECRDIYLAMRHAMDPAYASEEEVVEAARVIWNQLHHRMGGEFDMTSDTPAHAGTMAMARSVLNAAGKVRNGLPASGRKGGIYISSKIAHASKWRDLAKNLPIVSTWIHDPEDIAKIDWPDLWSRCIAEAAGAEVLVVYHEPGVTLKGAWIEVGAALAAGVPVLGVGIEDYTIGKSGFVRHFPDLDSALAEAEKIAAR
jgi:hypothetical protein